MAPALLLVWLNHPLNLLHSILTVEEVDLLPLAGGELSSLAPAGTRTDAHRLTNRLVHSGTIHGGAVC